jgi:hypothetical protein
MMIGQTEALQSLSFDGPLAAWQGIVCGCVLVAIAFWTLFGIRKDARHKLRAILFVLRVGAVAVLVWLLLGPVHESAIRHLTPKSLAVVTDVSQSMNVVDPPDKLADLRWQSASTIGANPSLLTVCDQAVSAGALARDQLASILRNGHRTTESQRVRTCLETSGRAAAAAVRLAEKCSQLLDESQSTLGPELASREKEVASVLAGSGVDRIGSLVPRDASRAPVLDRDALDRLEKWHRQLVQSVRALGQIADRVAHRVAEGNSGTPVATAHGPEILSRREKVDRFIKGVEPTWLSDLAGTHRIRRYTFDQQTIAVGDDKEVSRGGNKSVNKDASFSSTDERTRKADGGTNLSSALEAINRDATQAGIKAVLLLTDGRHNDPAAHDPRDAAKSLSEIPVYVVPVGSSHTPRDLILHHVDAPRAVVEGDQMGVEAIVTASDCAGEKCVVELSERSAVVDRQEIQIDSPRRDFRVRLTASSKGTGRHEYSLKILPVKGETVATNNSVDFGVDIIDATLRILVADDVPRWEFRYLVRLFERDKRVQYDQVLFNPTNGGPGENDSPAQLPRDVDEWSRYRLVILGDLNTSELDPGRQKALKEYLVDRGGTVILIAGDQAMPHAFLGMPLLDFLPVSGSEAQDPSQGYDLALSAEGLQNPAMQIADPPESSDDIWKEMTRQLPIYSLSQYCTPKPTALTLINATKQAGSDSENKAFLCWQTVGRGRIIYLAAPAVYQLRMKFGDRYHYRFWGQLVRWAVARDLSQGSKTVKLATDRSRAVVGDNVQVIANLSDLGNRPLASAEVRVQASTNGQAASLIELRPDPKIPGRYLGEFSPKEEGILSLQAFGADVAQLLASEGVTKPVTTTVMVESTPSVEMQDTRSNVPLLKQIAELTGGQIVPPTAVSQLVELTDLEPTVHEETIRQPIWNRWGLLWLFCGLLSFEWALRKATGLP